LVLPTPPTGAAPAEGAHIGIQLLDAPVSAAADPRANRYIIDHVAPGTSVQRRVRVTNSSSVTESVEMYAAAAAVVEDHFTFASARAHNEMTAWVSVDPATVTVPPRSSADISVRIDPPLGATSGEQFGVIWAEVAPAADNTPAGQVVQVYRAGVRIYLDVGPGGAPPTDFRIVSLTATRTDDGQPGVVAEVDNNGGRTLDLSGSLHLSDGPAAQSAGPFPADSGVSLLPGHRAEVVVRLNPALPDGPWRADLSLTSGLVERNATATLTFPSMEATLEPIVVASATDGNDTPWIPIASVTLLALAGATLLLRRVRRHPQPV
jgi:MYXO-CTERM domain-containing protein